jgi:hypothetical protein
MGYGMFFPAHQVGGQPELWDIRSYGVSGVWVKRSSTVYIWFHFQQGGAGIRMPDRRPIGRSSHQA